MDHLIDIEIEAEGWLDVLPDAAQIVSAGVTAALNAACDGHQQDVVVLLCDDDEMRALNKEYRQKNAPTNVLSFPAPKSMRIKGVLEHLGDIALGLETCVREAAEQGKSLEDHVTHLSVHGALHLLGYDHMDDAEAERMEGLERRILKTLGVADPYQAGPGTDLPNG
ncbi:MAG: rRNA maturation RNase YbeY [Asticcacaulis sp.]